MTPVIAALLKLGAPWIITAVFIILFMTERKSKDQLADKLYDLGIAMTKVNTEFSLTLQNVEKDVEEIRRHK